MAPGRVRGLRDAAVRPLPRRSKSSMPPACRRVGLAERADNLASGQRTVLRRVLWRPLPYRDSERLVLITGEFNEQCFRGFRCRCRNSRTSGRRRDHSRMSADTARSP